MNYRAKSEMWVPMTNDPKNVSCKACRGNKCGVSEEITMKPTGQEKIKKVYLEGELNKWFDIADFKPIRSKTFGTCRESDSKGHCFNIEERGISDRATVHRYVSQQIHVVCSQTIKDSRDEKVKLSIARFPLENDQPSVKRVEGKTQHSIQVGWRSDNLRLGDAGHFTCMNRTIILNITGTYKTSQRKESPRTFQRQILKAEFFIKLSDPQPPTQGAHNNMADRGLPMIPSKENKIFHLDCSVNGDPRPSITWFKVSTSQLYVCT